MKFDKNIGKNKNIRSYYIFNRPADIFNMILFNSFDNLYNWYFSLCAQIHWVLDAARWKGCWEWIFRKGNGPGNLWTPERVCVYV